ncbi:MAG: hypothetical protein KGZ92_09780 [Firmicutes bacterium]|nr:hypothetical protein [Dethiobacter sp.]MBS3889552.1 hypothetical protein [Bacillota bacterium]MBS4053604.1 hypothetical protein [Thermaerobacter sp.]
MNRRDIGTHVLAIGLALVLWFYVQSTQVRVQPEDIPVQRFPAVTLEVRNRPADLELVSAIVPTVSLTVRAPDEVLAAVTARDLIVYIDLRGLRAGSNQLAVRVDAPAGLEVVGVSPARVEVMLEPVTAVNLPVSLVLRGTLAPGYFAAPGVVGPASVTVFGGSTAVGQVVPVVVEVDVTGKTSTIESSRVLEAKDSLGQVVPKVTLNPPSIQYVQPIYPIKVLPLRFVAVGRPAPLVQSVRLESATATVEVAAPPEVLAGLSEIVIEVNIEGTAEDETREVVVGVPRGTFLVSSPTVSVQLLVTKSP